MAKTTEQEFDLALARGRRVYLAKHRDYGASWRIMRPSTLTDQLFIKASRIRNIEEGLQPMVDEDLTDEFTGLLNYGLMALMQAKLPPTLEADLDEVSALAHFDATAAEVRALMLRKNHDYGEAWRAMRVSSFTDIILTKLRRIKEIEDHDGRTGVSEGTESNYMDIVNYAIFAIIRLGGAQ